MIPAVLPTYNRAPLAFVSGQGSWLQAEDGSRYLDLGAGIAVNALGHANPALVETLSTQAAKLWHVSNLYRIPEQERLAAMLVDQTFADTVFFTNSGTEAAELAVKMVRRHWYDKGQPERAEILTFEGAFHGRSSAAIAAAGSEKMVKGLLFGKPALLACQGSGSSLPSTNCAQPVCRSTLFCLPSCIWPVKPSVLVLGRACNSCSWTASWPTSAYTRPWT